MWPPKMAIYANCMPHPAAHPAAHARPTITDIAEDVIEVLAEPDTESSMGLYDSIHPCLFSLP